MDNKKEIVEKVEKTKKKQDKKTLEERVAKLEKIVEEMRYVIGF